MKYAAAINVGSHEVSMTLAQLRQGREAKILERLSRTVATGSDTYRDGRISLQTAEELCELLAGFRMKLNEYPGIYVEAAATSAFREASNRIFVLDQIFRKSGISVRILSNNEENAYYLMALAQQSEGAASCLAQRCLFLELGAGSIQMSIFDRKELVSTQNLRLGSLRLRSLLSELAEHSAAYDNLLLEYISGDLKFYRRLEDTTAPVRRLIINGQELSYLRRLAGLPAQGPACLEKSVFLDFLKRLKQRSRYELVMKERIPEENASLLLPMALVIQEVFNFSGSEEALLPDAALEDGMLLELSARESGLKLVCDLAADRRSLALNLAERYRTDLPHCTAVEKLALSLFDQCQKLHGLTAEDREILSLAAILHNIGKSISTEEDDLRSYELVSSAELPGLSEAVLRLLALTVYYHNGNLSAEPCLFGMLADAEKLRLAKLCSFLAIANALDASHQQKISELKVKRDKGVLRLRVSAERDISLESWSLGRHGRLFEHVFAHRLDLHRREPHPS